MLPSSDYVTADVKEGPTESDVKKDPTESAVHQGCCAWYQFKGETSAKGYCSVG